jgi:hypothetical protein
VQLLLCCARTSINAATADTIESLCYGDLDWPWLLSLAAQHDVTCLLYQSLQDTCPDAVPAPVIDQLRQDFQTWTLNTLFFTQELLKLLQLFEALSPTLFRLRARDRISDQLQYFVWRLFVPNVRDRQLMVSHLSRAVTNSGDRVSQL